MQGMTVDQIVVDMSGRFTSGQAHIAFSRNDSFQKKLQKKYEVTVSKKPVGVKPAKRNMISWGFIAQRAEASGASQEIGAQKTPEERTE